jgi:PAS domain S-box-containing protein
MPSEDPQPPAFLEQVEHQFGICPEFFRSAHSPSCREALWSMAKFAYLDAPFPSLFKEKLFVYLSRFCRSSYCFSRHAGFLIGLGNSAGDPACERLKAEDIFDLLELPVPDQEELAEILARLESQPLNEGEWDTALESHLITLASISFRGESGSRRAEQALRRHLGPDRFDSFVLYLSFVRAAHYWTETHLDLRPERDIIEWLDSAPKLSAWIATNFSDDGSTTATMATASENELLDPEKFLPPPIPSNETDRLTALRMTGLLDTDPEPAYDDLARLAKGICGTPIALISLVDSDRQWFKAKIGIDAPETPRSISFCGHAICRPGEIMVIPDATKDDRFRNNPLVTGDPKIRFYAGVPLTDRHGHALGTLCVIDREPRPFTPEQREALVSLKRQFGMLLEYRHANTRLNAEIEIRKQLEARLRKRAETLLDLVEHATDLVQSIGPDGQLLYVNESWRTAFGYTTAEALKLNFFELVSPADRERCRSHLRAAMDGKEETQFDVSMVTRSGETLPLNGSLTCRQTKGSAGSIRGIFRRSQQPAHDSTQQDEFTCMCSWCKKIREPGGAWIQLEDYLTVRHQEKLTHGICAKCADEVLEDLNARAGSESE